MTRIEYDAGADQRLADAVRHAVSGITDAVCADAKRYCPVRSGALRDSLHPEMVDDTTGRVSSDKPYAAPVEMGYHLIAWGRDTHRFIPAQPYLRPSLFTRRTL